MLADTNPHRPRVVTAAGPRVPGRRTGRRRAGRPDRPARRDPPEDRTSLARRNWPTTPSSSAASISTCTASSRRPSRPPASWPTPARTGAPGWSTRCWPSPRYGEYLADVWQGYLISPLADDRRVRADRFRKWLAERFNTKTWDRIATELLTATGKMEENPAVIYLIEGRLPRTVPDLTDLTSRYFLGVRLNCAQCHDHPFVKWKQQDFWGMAAFFTQVQTPGKPKQVYKVGVKDDPELTLDSLQGRRHARRVPAASADVPRRRGAAADKQTTNRAALAAWLTSPKNPYFARAMVNRTWWRLFGRGIVQPVDDMHAANAPSHPELLDLLARRFAESGFDLKFLTRAIVLSRAYQRTSRPGDAPDKQAALFGRMSIKVLSAGQLYDSLVTIFGRRRAKHRRGRPAGRPRRVHAVLLRRRRPRPDRLPAGHPAPAAADELRTSSPGGTSTRWSTRLGEAGPAGGRRRRRTCS